MNPLQRPLDKITEPDKYLIHVRMYQIGHSELLLKVERNEAEELQNAKSQLSTFYLSLDNVIFFNGSLKWQGLRIVKERSARFSEILKSIHVDPAASSLYWLYRFSTDGEVEIIASQLRQSYDMPPQFKRLHP